MKFRIDVRVRTSDDKTVILDMKTGKYWHLNSTASIIAEGIQNGESLPEICALVSSVKNVAPQTAASDCAQFIQELSNAGLLEDVPAETRSR